MTEAQAIARAAIADTLSRYVVGVDEADFDAVVDCFTDDVDFQLFNPVMTGRDNIRKRFEAGWLARGAGEPGTYQRHSLTSSVIDFVSDTEATARTYLTVLTELGIDHTAVYIDRLVKVGDRWLIKVRTGTLDHMRPDSRFLRSLAVR